MNRELKAPAPDTRHLTPASLWQDLVEAEAEVPVEHGQAQKIEVDGHLRPGYWLNVAAEEPRLYYREDLYERGLLEAYRNGRAFERHAQRFLIAGVGIIGLIVGAASVVLIFELVMR